MTDTQAGSPAAAGGPASADQHTAIQLRQMLSAYRLSQAIHVAAVLGLADLLKDGPQDCTYLAERTGMNPDGVFRLLRSLAGVGIFEEVEPRTFTLNPLASLLQSEVEGSQHALAVMLGQDWLWRPWGRLRESVETGEPMFQAAVGMGFMEHMHRNAEARAVIQKAMAGANVRAAIADSYDFSKARTVADVGGGQGTVMATILARHPQVRGMLFDRPPILAMAKGVLGSAGVLDRCDLVDGDFFGTIPEGADILLLNQVLHNWHDEPAQQILTNCRRALPPDGKVLVVERVLADGYDPTKDSMSDLNMLVLMGGRERTQKEYDALLARAGLRTAGVQDMPEAWSLIEAVPND